MYAVPRGTLKTVAVSAKDDETRTASACSCILSPRTEEAAIVADLSDSLSDDPNWDYASPRMRVVILSSLCKMERVRKKEVASFVCSYPMVPIGEKLLNVEPGKVARSS